MDVTNPMSKKGNQELDLLSSVVPSHNQNVWLFGRQVDFRKRYPASLSISNNQQRETPDILDHQREISHKLQMLF